MKSVLRAGLGVLLGMGLSFVLVIAVDNRARDFFAFAGAASPVLAAVGKPNALADSPC